MLEKNVLKMQHTKKNQISQKAVQSRLYSILQNYLYIFKTEKLFLAHISSKEKLLSNDPRFVMMPQS